MVLTAFYDAESVLTNTNTWLNEVTLNPLSHGTYISQLTPVVHCTVYIIVYFILIIISIEFKVDSKGLMPPLLTFIKATTMKTKANNNNNNNHKKYTNH